MEINDSSQTARTPGALAASLAWPEVQRRLAEGVNGDPTLANLDKSELLSQSMLADVLEILDKISLPVRPAAAPATPGSD